MRPGRVLAPEDVITVEVDDRPVLVVITATRWESGRVLIEAADFLGD